MRGEGGRQYCPWEDGFGAGWGVVSKAGAVQLGMREAEVRGGGVLA